jgi:hypothetical protein
MFPYKRKLKCTIFCALVGLASCHGTAEESVRETVNGQFKILVRSQEFHHSGIRNVDICVAEVSSRKFPTDKAQCLLHGFDFSGLSVKWQSEDEIKISFCHGRVSQFTNDASVYTNGPVPTAFHATVSENCEADGAPMHPTMP